MPRKTAEDKPNGSPGALASMRPRPDAAENAAEPSEDQIRRNAASMRPRPDAAENVIDRGGYEVTRRRFNEAAARCRGKRGARVETPGRPRRFNEAAARCRGKRGPGAEALLRMPPGFNEAAARCRGKRVSSGSRRRPRRRFNEAAARCRGKPSRRGRHGYQNVGASMRPRPDAAENSLMGEFAYGLQRMLQ